MEFGIVKETRRRERRVALTPSTTAALASAGHGVLVEAGAGQAAGYTDTEYVAAGADLMWNRAELVANSTVLVKVQAPLADESLLRDGLTLVGFLHLGSAEPGLRAALRAHGCTAIALELIAEPSGERPILEPMSELGGRVAIGLASAQLLAGEHGPGRLLGGAPGVPPLHVVVLGAGVAGAAAAREAWRHGARVTVLDRDPRSLTRLVRRAPHLATAIASPGALAEALRTADLVVGAVAVPGQPAPRILTRGHMRQLPNGALFVDLSIDEGGCAETSRATTPDAPVYTEEGVRHMCVPNLSTEVAHTASEVLSNAVLPYLLDLATHGVQGALGADPSLAGAAVFVNGELRHPQVAASTGERLDP